jgi:hypothetical protein
MIIQKEITLSNELAFIIADAINSLQYEVALFSEQNNSINSEVSSINTGYERQPLVNITTRMLDKKITLSADPIVFSCIGERYVVARVGIVAKNLPNEPVIAFSDLERSLYDGDDLTINFLAGFISLSLG